MTSYLFLNPSKKLSAISRKHSFFKITFSERLLHFLTFRLLTLKDDMVALLGSDLGYGINCC
jgi:hypothetical protein